MAQGAWLFEPVQLAVGSSAKSEAEAGRVQAQQTLLHGLSRHLAQFPVCVLGEANVPFSLHTGSWPELLPPSWASGLVPVPAETGMAGPFSV